MAQAPIVGMVGAGQLARMTAQAAVSLDVRMRILAGPDEVPVTPAGVEVARGATTPAELIAFGRTCDVVTFDHEGVAAASVAAVEAEGIAVRPAGRTLALAVDKSEQRWRLAEAGFPVPTFAVAEDRSAVADFVERHGPAVVVKAATGGYDGRGVWFVEGADEAVAVLERCGRVVLEPVLDLDRELAVIVARRPGGEAVVYPVVETVQRAGICREVLAPARVDPAIAAEAAEVARGIAEHLDATGLLAVELFVVDGAVLVNELAARPHNSGHLTIEGAVTSQFENHLRAVLDWPLGPTDLRAPAVAMANVITESSDDDLHARLPDALALGPVHVHLYGKSPRPGRKVGHVTVLADDLDVAADLARRAADVLIGRDAP
ncbi:MAG TPA: 5-(carboxyamino)imidazole ribonucleotide synthase [Acidimicrobiales bacterium]|nr:5-(carboxyamino)imidazole ribonucleotide synthase [Acidimicrobiales bacterium]